MALTKVQAEGINLADTFAFTGTISGLPSGSEAFSARGTGGITADAVDNTILKLDDNFAFTGTVTSKNGKSRKKNNINRFTTKDSV